MSESESESSLSLLNVFEVNLGGEVRPVGEEVVVSADIFAEGHDVLAAVFAAGETVVHRLVDDSAEDSA